jgi:hypothetical protein
LEFNRQPHITLELRVLLLLLLLMLALLLDVLVVGMVYGAT